MTLSYASSQPSGSSSPTQSAKLVGFVNLQIKQANATRVEFIYLYLFIYSSSANNKGCGGVKWNARVRMYAYDEPAMECHMHTISPVIITTTGEIFNNSTHNANSN